MNQDLVNLRIKSEKKGSACTMEHGRNSEAYTKQRSSTVGSNLRQSNPSLRFARLAP